MAKGNAEAIKEATKVVGGYKQLAQKVGVSYKTILDWTSGRSGVTITNALKIEKATDGVIKAKEILPDFPWEDIK